MNLTILGMLLLFMNLMINSEPINIERVQLRPTICLIQFLNKWIQLDPQLT